MEHWNSGRGEDFASFNVFADSNVSRISHAAIAKA